MAERPILFSAPMVRAILSGSKTMTRRVLKPQPLPQFKPTHFKAVSTCNRTGRKVWEAHDQSGPMCPFPGPPGCLEAHVYTISPGDLLWVRETWQVPAFCHVQYRATATERIGHWNPNDGRWKPSIHMPRWASRLTLEVTDVKVERLQEITEEDAIAEGCPGHLGPNQEFPDEWDPSPREEFEMLWKEIYGRDAWDSDPWCAAFSFVVHQANIDSLPRKKAA